MSIWTYRTETQEHKSSEIGTDTRKGALNFLRYKGRAISRMLGTKISLFWKEGEKSTQETQEKSEVGASLRDCRRWSEKRWR